MFSKIIPSFFTIKEVCSKIIPSFFTIKEGSTSHLGLLSSGEKKETALLGARNRYALRLADHQRSSPDYTGWDRRDYYLNSLKISSKQLVIQHSSNSNKDCYLRLPKKYLVKKEEEM